jgi:lipoprotein-anchoring transpeptidase ErfK/SrfK
VKIVFYNIFLVSFFGCTILRPLPYNERDIKVEIVISERKLHLYDGDRQYQSYDIAVGKETHPTPVGDFKIHRIDWNPDWTPPDSEWSRDQNYKPPGHPQNPMGRARIVYQSPYTIHGTEDIESLGNAESHGSVRMSNEEVIELAQILMEAGGINKKEKWYKRVIGTPDKMVRVNLKKAIPLTNKP